MVVDCDCVRSPPTETVPPRGRSRTPARSPVALPGGRIRVRLTPYFEYLVDAQRQVTRVHSLRTEVVANEGEEITLGGVPAEDSEFRERFLIGYDRARGTSQASITLRATVE